MKFKGKIDLWIWIIMLAGEAMVLFAFLGEDGPSVVGFLTALIYNLAFLPFVIRNYVEIKEDVIYVVDYYWGIKKEKHISRSDITSAEICIGYSPFSGVRVRLFYFRTVLRKSHRSRNGFDHSFLYGGCLCGIFVLHEYRQRLRLKFRRYRLVS